MRQHRKRNRRKCHSKLSAKARFYKNLRSYLLTLSVLFMAGVLIDNDFFEVFRTVGLWWGIFVVVTYFKAKGLPGTNGWLSDDWFDWILRRHPAPEGDFTSPRPDTPGEDYDPLWKDKDLV